MKFLTLNYIKQHSRIDYSGEDEMLELYAESAEETLLNYIGRTYEELVESNNGTFPTPLIHAALMLVDTSYTYRSQVSPTNIYLVPYTFDILVKPYIKL